MPPQEFGPQSGTQYSNQGYGPVNYSNKSPDPFSQLDDYISYQNMVRVQQASQYQQKMGVPLDLTQKQMYKALTNPGFQQNLDASSRETMYRSYERKREAMRENFSAQVVNQSVQWGAMGAMTTPVTMAARTLLGAGAAGAVGGFVASAAIPMALTAPISMSIEGELKRRQVARGISNDLDQYRRQIGGNFSYQQTSDLGHQIQRNTYRGGFFNTGQQLDIMKTGLSTGLLDSRNNSVDRMITTQGGVTADVVGAIRQGGTTQQFTKNFEQLKAATKDIVKMLQTTVEGGMSVIKELQQSGFKSIGDIRNQVVQAKAFGDITGVGSQNMMLIGRAGAMAVQGTGWSAQAGAQMYQQAATTLGLQSQVSPMMSRSVERAGGLANAGAMLATAQMNMLNSGMGTRVVAAALNADGSINQNRLNTMLNGGMSASGITMTANGVGAAMGPGGRAMFDLTRQRALEQMDERTREGLVQSGFDAWRGNKSGNKQQQAWVYAGMFTNDPVARELMMNNMTTPKFYDKQMAAMNAQQMALGASRATPYLAPPLRGMASGMRYVGRRMEEAGNDIVNMASDIIGRPDKAGLRDVWNAIGYGALDIMEGEKVTRSRYVDPARIAAAQYGINERITGDQQAAMDRLSSSRKAELRAKDTNKASSLRNLQALGIDAQDVYSKLSAQDYNLLNQELLSYSTGVVDSKKIMKSFGKRGVLGKLGVDASVFANDQTRGGIIQGLLNEFDTINKGEQIKISEANSAFAKYASANGGQKAYAEVNKGVVALMQSSQFLQAGILDVGGKFGSSTQSMSQLTDMLVGQGKPQEVAAAIAAGALSITNRGKNITDSSGDKFDPKKAEDRANRAKKDFFASARNDVLNSYEEEDDNVGSAQGVRYSGKRAVKKGVDLEKLKYKEMLVSLSNKPGSEAATMAALTGYVEMMNNPLGGMNFDSWISKNSDWIKANSITLGLKKGGKALTDLSTLSGEQFTALAKSMEGIRSTYSTDILKVGMLDLESRAAAGMGIADKNAYNFANYYNQDVATGKIKGAKLTEKQLPLLSALYNNDATQFRANITSVSPENLKKVLKQGMGLDVSSIPGAMSTNAEIETFVKNVNGQLTTDKAGVSAKAQKLTQLNEVVEQIDKLSMSIDAQTGGYTKTDKDGKVVADAEAEKKMERLSRAREALNIAVYGNKEGATAGNGSGMDNKVAPPVLNFWNNKWT